MKTFIREHTREYSLIRIQCMARIYDLMIKELGVKQIEFCMVCRDGGLVAVHYTKETFEDIFKQLGKKASDKKWLEEQIKILFHYFEKLMPYFKGEKTPKNLEELKLILDEYVEAFYRTGIMYVAPLIPALPEEIKKIALDARADIQEYNESMEDVIDRTMNNLYPQLNGDVRFILQEEIWSGEIKKLEIKNKIAERKRSYIFYNNKLYTGDIDALLKRFGIVLSHGADIKETNTINGQIAFKGIVKGTVRIVSNTKDAEKVRKGDILVSVMTMPKYIAAMGRAAAFVTDEGGIT